MPVLGAWAYAARVLRNKRLVDVGLALAFTVASMLLGREQVPQPGWESLDSWGYALTALVNLPVAARRRVPGTVCLIVCLAWAGYVSAGYWPVVNCLAPLLALYTVTAARSLRTALGCAALTGGVWLYAGLANPASSMATVTVQAAVFPLVICRFGHAARVSAERGDQLAVLTGQLRAEQAERARRAVAQEQGRIARELHDVVAHHMSVISVQAGMAGYVFGSDPDAAHDALRTISDTSREGLEELRRMLAVLRTDDNGDGQGPASYDSVPGLARLDEMAGRVRAAGVPVELTVTGRPRPLAPGVELCAYRVVQEALTNVLKHAPAARAVVVVAYGARQLSVAVTDDGGTGERTNPDRVLPGAGHGLMGMRERARLYGGTVDIGPRPEGGFGVVLTLPTTASATPQGDEKRA
ncbi:sensor histidine kinase [Streptomyces sp. NPDC059818]|uniref:sensor histidine kinase n=1 Tax=Streptomyces sp. NPDC059818 TaxID=3346962 RepID=UPI0036505FEC